MGTIPHGRAELHRKAGESFPPAKLKLLLPNPRVAESDEYLTNSHIFYKAFYPVLNTE
jgi:hypothetical protein